MVQSGMVVVVDVVTTHAWWQLTQLVSLTASWLLTRLQVPGLPVGWHRAVHDAGSTFPARPTPPL